MFRMRQGKKSQTLHKNQEEIQRHVENRPALYGQRKNAKTAKMLGYNVTELWNHLTTHPNWDVVKDGEWHIDHIFPIIAFIDHGIIDVSVINALSNLQPLSAQENMKKKDHYNRQMFRSTYDL